MEGNLKKPKYNETGGEKLTPFQGRGLFVPKSINSSTVRRIEIRICIKYQLIKDALSESYKVKNE